MRVPVILTNWKMNKTIDETKEYFRRFLSRSDKYRAKAETLILVPHTVLVLAVDLAKDSGIKIGSQDHFWEDFGPYTGEISAAMVRDCGAEYTMLGHYERRKYFHETNEIIYRKTRAALRNQLIPIVCIGESIEERKGGQTLTALRGQIDTIFSDLVAEEMTRIQILYEPFWAIGAEDPPKATEAQKAHRMIRRTIGERFGKELAHKLRILYGGSVRSDNVAEFIMQADIDGVGVGRSGWDPDSFLNILEAATKVQKKD
jgi:triosephosphate isomerase